MPLTTLATTGGGRHVRCTATEVTAETMMPDNLKRSGGQDRKRIDVSQEHELRDWSKKFGVSAARLKEAVQAVGTQADKVQRHLSSGSGRKPAKRSSARAE